MSEANDPAFWNHVTLVELAEKCKKDFERVRAAASGWKPNRDYQVRPREGLHVQFFAHGNTYVGTRDAEGNWKDAIWGKNGRNQQEHLIAALVGE